MSFLQQQVTEALRSVDDPELGVNIVDLGLVRSITIDGGAVTVIMMVTTPTCPLGSFLSDSARTAVEARLGPTFTVMIILDKKAVWSPDLAIPEVRARFQKQPSFVASALKKGVSRLLARA